MRISDWSSDVCSSDLRGFGECRASKWAAGAAQLLDLMNGVRCLAGKTQIEKVLGHAIRENAKQPVDALVLVGDMMEEKLARLSHIAGDLGLLKVPDLSFHEGGEPDGRHAFEPRGRLAGAAHCHLE